MLLSWKNWSEYSTTYDEKVVLKLNAIHIGSLLWNITSIKDKLPSHYHNYLLLFDPEDAEKLLDSRDCDHKIELVTSEDKLRMGPIYQLSQEEENISIQYPEKMIEEKKIPAWSSLIGSPKWFVPKPNGKGLRLCVDYRPLNDHTKKDKTLLPVMEALKQQLRKASFITKIVWDLDFIEFEWC